MPRRHGVARATTLLAAALALLAASCGGPPFPATTRIDDEARRLDLASRLPPRVSGPRKVELRMLLEKDGVEGAFVLHGRLVPPDRLVLVAVSDFGATVFDLERTAGRTKARSSSPWVEARFLERHLGEDTALVFLSPPADAFTLVRLESGEDALFATHGSRAVLARGGLDGPPETLEIGAEGRSSCVARILRWGRDAESGSVYPARIEMEGRAERYRASIDVLRWEPATISPPLHREPFREGSS